MSFLHNINTVARYEAKTLRRSWFFRLFSIGSMIILTFMNIGLFSPIGGGQWDLQALSSAIPYCNLYLVNIGQAIVVIFLAADFLRRDKKLDTSEVLYTRSMSNFEYITGKTWGIIRLFIGLDVLILGIGLLMNIISTNMTVDLLSYVQYLFIICIPTIVFSLGVAFVLMQIIRNQAVTFMLLLGYAALDMFYLFYRAGWIFDYMAFAIPLFKSGMIGFGNTALIANQRLLYLLSGLSMIMATVLLFKRLPQSRFQSTLAVALLIIFFSGALVTGYNTWETYADRVKNKKLVIETNRLFENKKFPVVTNENIDLTHKGKEIEASAFVRIKNNNKEDLTSYLFSLNPSLNVLSVKSGATDLQFKRTWHIIEIKPSKVLRNEESDTITIRYTGSIDESFCYPDFKESSRTNPYMAEMLVISKRQAFLTDKYVLLTPESHWYPVAGLNYYPTDPARIKVDFTRFNLYVHTAKDLVAVSQGNASRENGTYVFSPETPLSGLTLAIGNYIRDSLKVDSVKYLSYHFPGNDYYKKDLAALKDTLPLLVSGIMRELETSFSTRYPFSTLILVEVPVQFYSYPRMNTQTRAEVQPSMVLVPERLVTLEQAGFAKRFTRQKKRMVRNNEVITDKELQLRLFNDFIRNTFISGEEFRYRNGVAWNEPVRYRLGPSFYFFKNNFWSEEYPVINAVFETHLQKAKVPEESGFTGIFSSLSDNDKANLLLRKQSFREVLAANPSGDTLREVLGIKGDYLFNLLRAKAGIEKFDKWFRNYLDKNRFKSVNISELNDTIRKTFNFEFYPYLNDWFNKKDQPGFRFSNLTASEIIVNDRSRYQLTFVASNPEPVAGLFNVSVRMGGSGQNNQSSTISNRGSNGSFSVAVQGRGMEASDISRIVLLGPHETRKVGVVLDAEPRELLINTIFSRNLPGIVSMPVKNILRQKEREKEFIGDEVIPSESETHGAQEIIVDNEDPGFNRGIKRTEIPLKRILGIRDYSNQEYHQEIKMWSLPDYWQPVVKSEYYGRYVHSVVYTRAGTGDKSVSWTTPLTSPGYYNIYCYVGKPGEKATVGQGDDNDNNENRGASPYLDMHYKVFSDEGVGEIIIDYVNAGNGWNLLGRYHLSSDSARVVLTNQSSGKVVIGDAIRWVKAD